MKEEGLLESQCSGRGGVRQNIFSVEGEWKFSGTTNFSCEASVIDEINMNNI